jgi:hypothetical protein
MADQPHVIGGNTVDIRRSFDSKVKVSIHFHRVTVFNVTYV